MSAFSYGNAVILVCRSWMATSSVVLGVGGEPSVVLLAHNHLQPLLGLAGEVTSLMAADAQRFSDLHCHGAFRAHLDGWTLVYGEWRP